MFGSIPTCNTLPIVFLKFTYIRPVGFLYANDSKGSWLYFPPLQQRF